MDVPGFEERGRQTGRLSSRRTDGLWTNRAGPNRLNSKLKGCCSKGRHAAPRGLNRRPVCPSPHDTPCRPFEHHVAYV